MAEPDDVLTFWLNDVGPAGWYIADDAVDQMITARFMPTWEHAAKGGLTEWCQSAEGALAYLIVTDQFSRNIFRGDARSFATDAIARDVARRAVLRGFDLATAEPERVFFYMPFEHSEELADQDWSVAFMETRLPESGEGFAFHARVHREVIRRFARFPYRNGPLGRQSSAEEEAFLAKGGYGAMVRELGG